MEKFLAFVILVIVVSGCSSIGGNKVPDMKVLNIDDLQKDYRASKDAARTKYDGKEFVVLGRAGEPLGEYPLKSEDGKYLYYTIRASEPGGMNCFVAIDDRSKFDSFKKDDVIAVKGTIHIEDGNFNMKPCTREFRDTK